VLQSTNAQLPANHATQQLALVAVTSKFPKHLQCWFSGMSQRFTVSLLDWELQRQQSDSLSTRAICRPSTPLPLSLERIRWGEGLRR